jgi:SNF2 family DNA or RNA helicase
MITLRITPSGRLNLDIIEDTEITPALRSLSETFAADWREGLFLLGTSRESLPHFSGMRFWAGMAARYLSAVCHLSDAKSEVEPPDLKMLITWVDNAPPMPGAEYLTLDSLARIWFALADWGRETMSRDGGVEKFLSKRAPGWNAVGRVSFHLAENKIDPDKPFAFMVSFSTGISEDGQVRHLPLRKALELYAGARNKPALMKLLTPIKEVGTRCDWVKEMIDNGDIYRPMAWSANKAYKLLCSVPLLEESGLVVRLPDWWRKRPGPQVKATIGETKKPILGTESMLDFRVDVTLDGDKLSPRELDELLKGEDGLVLFKGKWVEVDKERLQQALDHWKAVEKEAGNDGLSFIEGMRLLAGTDTALKEVTDSGEERAWAEVVSGKALKKVLNGLRNPANLSDSPELTRGIKATLRPYQREGANWLNFLSALGLGACLADDMGLGKTLQVLTVLNHLYRGEKKPSLLIIPASLLGNWQSEARRFAPALSILFAHPAEIPKKDMEKLAENSAEFISGYNLVVTTYALVVRNSWIAEQDWNLIILDEAQAIKNHTTKQSRAVRKLKAKARIALTGTPVENRVGDLWSLFDFLNPGLLGTAAQFKRFIKDMEGGANPFAPFRKLVAPYILRRLKTDKTIIADLPDKTEVNSFCGMSKQQIKQYELVVRTMKRKLLKEEEMDKMARRGLVLQTMIRLKQICNHPAQFTGQGDYTAKHSGKFVRLTEITQELAERQEKILIFTQFTEIIPALHDHLSTIFGRSGLIMHGATAIKKRKSIVEKFQHEDGPPFFILSLKAGGTGLNLTAASHVIHFDRWWNPAVENQATDRCFRIGQKKNVLVHKFVTTGTIEEKIDQMINDKKELAENLLGGGDEMRLTELSDKELLNLVQLDLSKVSG